MRLAITTIAATMLSTAAMAQNGPVATDCVNDISCALANRTMAACAVFGETSYAKVSSDCKKLLNQPAAAGVSILVGARQSEELE